MALSSTNILMVWLCFEVNLFSFIPLLLNSATNNETEASITYFLAQALGSALFLLRRTILLTIYWFRIYRKIILIISIIIKIWATPCLYWYPITIELARWINCFILSNWQKIAPVFVLIYIIKKTILLILIIAPLNAILGVVNGLGQRSLKNYSLLINYTHRMDIKKIKHKNTIPVYYLFTIILNTNTTTIYTI